MKYIIYKLQDKDNKIYIGSTTNLKERLQSHKRQDCNDRGYKARSSKLDLNSMKVSILYEGEFEKKYDAENLEYSYIEYYDLTGECVNFIKKRPTELTKKAYRDSIKNKVKISNIEYKKKNKEHCKALDKRRYYWRKSMDGDPRSYNNNSMMRISMNLFH